MTRPNEIQQGSPEAWTRIKGAGAHGFRRRSIEFIPENGGRRSAS
jgi:hypothetical protein